MDQLQQLRHFMQLGKLQQLRNILTFNCCSLHPFLLLLLLLLNVIVACDFQLL
jgi:hypothetical protein